MSFSATQAQKHNSWIEINAASLRHNARVLAAHVGPKVSIGAMLKSNAYGHGVPQVVSAIHDQCAIYYTLLLDDALRIRAEERRLQLPRKRILVVGAVGLGDVPILIDNEIECAVVDDSWPEILARSAPEGWSGKLKVHLFIDTGLGREGVRWDDVSTKIAPLVNLQDRIEIIGVMTHFSDAECPNNLGYAETQLGRFRESIDELTVMGLVNESTELHAAASSPAVVFPEARLSSVRFGLSLYGCWTADESRVGSVETGVERLSAPLDLRPALSWRAESLCIKRLTANESIGYNRSYVCDKPTTVAILPVGYFDGYPYAPRAQGVVLVNGKRCPIVGCVMMNNIVVDITDIDVDVREPIRATLLGRDGDEQITVDDLADVANSINYHVLASLGPHLERIVVDQCESGAGLV